jgi:hypothetical protein
VVLAWFLWTAASSAITSARVRSRLPALDARTLARRVVTVPADLPLTEGIRRAQEQEAGSIVTLGPDGVRVFPTRLRWITPEELDALAAEAGLAPVARWASWRREPFSAASRAHVSVYGKNGG